MSVVNKTLGAAGFLLFFCFGVLSNSFASYDEPPSALRYQTGMGGQLDQHGLAQAERKNLDGGALLEDEGILPKPTRDLIRAPVSAATAVGTSQISSSSRPDLPLKSPILDLSAVLNL